MIDNELIRNLNRFCSVCNHQVSLEDYFLEKWEGSFQVIIDNRDKLYIRVEKNRVEYGFGTIPKFNAKFEMPSEIAKTVFSGNTFATDENVRKSIKKSGPNDQIIKFFQLSDLVWFNKDKF